MVSQNIPGIAVLRTAGYTAPISPVIGWTGITTLLALYPGVLVAGNGRLIRYDENGKKIREAASPHYANVPPCADSATANLRPHSRN